MMIEWLTVEVPMWVVIVSLLCTSGAAATPWIALGMYWRRRAMKAERELKTCMGFGTYSAATQERTKELTREGLEAALCEFRDGVKQEPGK